MPVKPIRKLVALHDDDADFDQASRVCEPGFDGSSRRRVAFGDPRVPCSIHAGEVHEVGEIYNRFAC